MHVRGKTKMEEERDRRTGLLGQFITMDKAKKKRENWSWAFTIKIGNLQSKSIN